MKFRLISKVVAISALALLSFACSNTASKNPTQAASSPQAVASASPTTSGAPVAALSQSWTLINFGAPW